MPTFEQIPLAGNQDAQNVFRITIGDFPCSDLPRITAWDDYNMNTVSAESLAGTPANGNVSSICAIDTTLSSSGTDWATGLAQNPGGQTANRLKGNDSYITLGNVAPGVGDTRTFQLAVGVAADFTPGTTGHEIVIGVTVYYTGSAPSVTLEYNSSNSETTPNWVGLNMQSKGVSTPPAYPNTVFATGPDSTTTSIDPVTKPDTGEKFAEEYWVQTAA